jgi:hypothetical protein
MIEVIYPNNDGPERPRESVVDEMNNILAENTRDGETMPTVQKIAEALGIDAPTYHHIVRNDEKFIGQTRQYLSFHKSGLPDAYHNRLDAVMVAINVIEAHQRHLKENTG